MALVVGEQATDFELPDSTGAEFRMSSLAGSWVVLWWFPRAGTEGCSIQSRGVEKLAGELAGAGVEFVGVSYDSPEANAVFCSETAPHVRFLSDSRAQVAPTYGAKRPPDDPRADVPLRITYVLDPDLRVHEILVVTDVSRHADDVRAILAAAGVGGV